MNYNYHTHTYLCGHANGTPEEYVETAIKGGIEFMGFSDHIPYINKIGKESFYRVPADKGKKYISEISGLRKAYKDKLEISIGFESEYYSDVFEDMLRYAKSTGGEYLILGPHYLREADTEYTMFPRDSYDFLREYVSNITEAIKTGVFTYVAHPDLLYFTGETDLYSEEMRKICITSRECGIPLEINFLGIRDKRIYPNDIFWQIAGEEKAPVTFGFDAHTPESACDRSSLKKAEELVRKNNLNYIGKPEIKRL